jgi:hypothetical protein
LLKYKYERYHVFYASQSSIMNEMSYNHHELPHHRELSATYLSQASVAVTHTRFTVVRPANAIAGDMVYYVTITNTSV